MVRVAFIGAGSKDFSRKLIGDVLAFPALDDTEFALMDIDEHRLEQTTWAAETMIENEGLDATVESTLDRREALNDADYVINAINVGGTEPFENEIRIPERYGVKQAIGDTLGPGGVFRALRTIPTMLDIARDIEERCPDALLLNYTNPMAMLCWTLAEATDVETLGLCHSIPHTINAIGNYIGIPGGELEYWIAGINHMAWVLECTHDGEDVYPLLEDAMTDPETYRQDTVRFEVMKHFGTFPTESSHHLSEYLPYFRTDEETIEAMTGDWYASRMPTATYLEDWKVRSGARDASSVEEAFDEDDLVVEHSEEYASRIIHSIETGQRRRMNINLSNRGGLIGNLPEGACVEVPCMVDGTGVRPSAIGDLPPHLAALNRTNINVQERVVTAALESDLDAVYQAVKLDPLTGAALTLDEIHEMTTELLEANAEYLPAFD